MTLKLPEDIDAEQCLIATLGAPGTLDPGTENADALQAILAIRPEQIVHPVYSAILAAILDIYGKAEPVNCFSLKSSLERQGTLGRVGGYSGLMESLSAEEVGRPTKLVARLLDLWRQRQVLRVCHEAMLGAADPMQPVQGVISTLSGKLSALAAGSGGAKIRKGSTLVDRIAAGEAFRDSTIAAKLVWFGIHAFDEVLECSPGHVVMIGARPGVGKSALGIQVFWQTVLNGGSPFLVSLEMDDGEVDSRIAAWRTLEGYRHFRDGSWTDNAANVLMDSVPELDRTTIWCHTSGVPWATVEAAIREAVRVNGCTSVILDHVLLIEKPNLGKGSNDAACWLWLSRQIKKLAGELRICIVPLCQLNRQGAEGEPKLSDFRDSGGWEEDAVAVLMVWQVDATAADELVEARDLFVKVAKNRSGASGWKRKVEFRGATNRFAIVEQHTTASDSPTGQPCASSFWGGGD